MSLLKCRKCGEMFSDSYKSCPFCAEDEEYYNGKVKKRNHRRMEQKAKAPSIVGPLLVLVIILIIAAAVWAIFGDGIKGWFDGRPGVEHVDPQPGHNDDDQQQGDDVVLEKKLTLNKSVLMLSPGASEQLTVSGVAEGTECVWQNSDPAVLTVSEDGKVTAVAEGSAVVTVTCGDESAVCAVTVKENMESDDPVIDDPEPPTPVDTKVDLSKINITVPLYGTSLSKIEDGKFDVSLGKGESFGLEVTGTDVKPNWSVANSSIATVSSDGTIKGITSGETTITAKLGDVSVEIIVRVK